MKKTTQLTIVLVLSVLFSNCKHANSNKVDVDQRAQFTGILRHEMFWGPPGFGEDTTRDEEEPAYILHVDPSFLFRDTALASEFGIRADTCGYDTVSTIQVRFDPQSNINGKNLRTLVGKKIKIECTLYGAHTGHHHAPALTEKVFAITQE